MRPAKRFWQAEAIEPPRMRFWMVSRPPSKPSSAMRYMASMVAFSARTSPVFQAL